MLNDGIDLLDVLVPSPNQGLIDVAVKIVGHRTDKAYPGERGHKDRIYKECEDAPHVHDLTRSRCAKFDASGEVTSTRIPYVRGKNANVVCTKRMQNAIDTLTTAPSAVPSSTGFTRRFLLLAGATSAAVVLPCYWHRSIAAGDLASHTYNAWLAQLVAQGQAPGLYLAHQWNNILLDVALTRLGGVVGFGAAEKIVVPVGVLIFFWGAFALIAAATDREPWFLTPAIAMVAYGWTFQMGFLNYYLSLGLAFFSVALSCGEDTAAETCRPGFRSVGSPGPSRGTALAGRDC